MKAQDLALFVKGIAPVVKDFVALSVKAFSDRLDAVEQRAAVPGPIGAKGDPGVGGADGSAFRVGHGNPSFEGKSGDGYLDVTTGDIYEWR